MDDKDRVDNDPELTIIIAAAAAAGKDEITIERDGKKTTIRIKQQDSEGRELLAD